MGHEQFLTTLNGYTHASPTFDSRARALFADFPLSDPEK
jgi:hypothetical protein